MPSNTKPPNSPSSKSPNPPSWGLPSPSSSPTSAEPPSSNSSTTLPSQTLPGSSTKPSKSKGRTKKPRPPPPTPFAISTSTSHMTPEEKDCLVKAMALPVGDHIASRGKRTPANVLDEIREDQATIALAQRVLEHPHKGKGKATDKLEPSRNMLTTIADWLKQECMETERCLREMAEAASHADPSSTRSASYVDPASWSSTSKVPLTPAPEPRPSQTRRKPRKKQAPESSTSPTSNLRG